MRAMFVWFFCLMAAAVSAQDTTVYAIPAKVAFLRDCRKPIGSPKDSIADKLLFAYLSKFIQYPDSARMAGLEGTVYLRFVVEPDGSTSNHTVLKGIGGGCNEEAIRAIVEMPKFGVCWEPGRMENNAPVRTFFTVPVKFKLQEPLPYTFIDADTVYTDIATAPAFVGGDSLLQIFLKKAKPSAAQTAKCEVLNYGCDLLVKADKSVKIIELYNYSNGDLDSDFNVNLAIHSSSGKWLPATYDGRFVSAIYTFRTTVKPDGCPTQVANADRAVKLSDSAQKLYEEGKQDEALAQMNEAVTLFPNNIEFKYIRGMMHFNNNRFAEACADLTEVKAILKSGWFETILPAVCKQAEKK